MHKNDANDGINIIRRIKNRINKLYAYKGYYLREIYNELDGKAIIPVRRNASTLSKDNPYRSKITRFIKRFNEELWKIKNAYNLRWNIEIYFSEINRLFGEIIRAVKPEYINSGNDF